MLFATLLSKALFYPDYAYYLASNHSIVVGHFAVFLVGAAS